MLEKYYRINEAIGVSIMIAPNGSLQVNACSIVVNNNKLDFDKKVTGLTYLEELNKHIPAKSYIAINLSGKGILLKQIEKVETINQNNFSSILPNANIEEFYIQNFISGNESFVSIIRKAEADKWIDQLKGFGFTPLMFSLGPFPIQNIIPQLNIYEQEVNLNGYTIQRNEQLEWTSVTFEQSKASSFPIKIESEIINEKLVIPYAAAFQLVLAEKVPLVKAEVPVLEIAYNGVVADKRFKVNVSLILAAFFVLLLINFLVFSWLNSANSKLTDKVSMSAQSTINIKGISDQLKEKESLLNDLGWDGGINKSALVDQLASVLPQELTWNEIAINPIDQSASRTQKSLVFANRQIRVTGNSAKIIPVNEWIARVKTKPWVKDIQLDSYVFNNELNSGQFTIIIKY